MRFDSGSPPANSALTLDPMAQAVAAARRFVRETLASVGGEALIDNAELAVSELVTNATLHARTPMTIGLARTPAGRLRLSVRDHSTVAPQPRAYALTATTGRGLRLVEAVSLAWGVDPVPAGDGAGKVVWCEPAADAVAASQNGEWGDVIAELV
jgi:anti-sigma regulatory factor (Ser/Thr protein kinase)